jgi:hypothetical protein
MLYPTELSCILLTYAAPFGAMLHLIELSCNLLSYPAPSEVGYTLLSYTAPY